MKERKVGEWIMCLTKNDEINEAVAQVEIAQKQFDYADKEFIDVAIMKLSHAMEKLNVLIKLSKINN
jgi:mannose-1-phosphate guanylyltransferase